MTLSSFIVEELISLCLPSIYRSLASIREMTGSCELAIELAIAESSTIFLIDSVLLDYWMESFLSGDRGVLSGVPPTILMTFDLL